MNADMVTTRTSRNAAKKGDKCRQEGGRMREKEREREREREKERENENKQKETEKAWSDNLDNGSPA
eukprot:5575817-Pyramimonas_sp.AAC.1